MNALTFTTLAFFIQSTPRPLLLHLCDHTLHVASNIVMLISFKKDYKARIITCQWTFGVDTQVDCVIFWLC